MKIDLTDEERALILLVLGNERLKAEYKFNFDRRKLLVNLQVKLKEAK